MGRFVSSIDKSKSVSFKEAVLSNVPSFGGLYIPESLKTLSNLELEKICNADFPTTAQITLNHLLEGEIPRDELLVLCKNAYPFDIPLKTLSPSLGVLELFHGPTLAFKDVGVRFMAEVLTKFSPKEERTILTVTSGDTGAAVSGAFFKRPNTRVIVPYPKGRISKIQEQQIAGLGENILAYAVNGSFDDCQRMVNEVFADKNLVQKLNLTSANSINSARLLPQVAYYAYAWKQLREKTKNPLLFSVPSGNFGNVTAGLIAKKIGIPIDFLLAATNENDLVPQYLSGKEYKTRPVQETISTAMDIAVPNNFPRIEALFGPGANTIKKNLLATSVTVEENKRAIKELYSKYKYLADPHGALAYWGATRIKSDEDLFRVFLETAHPVKFPEVVKEILGIEPEIPGQARNILEKKVFTKELDKGAKELSRIL